MSGFGKGYLPPFLLATSELNSSFTTAVTTISMMDNICAQVIWSGASSPVGTMDVQGSLNYSVGTGGTVLNAGTWTGLGLNTAVSGSSGTILFDLNQLSFPYIRLSYTASSGDGYAAIWIAGKAEA